MISSVEYDNFLERREALTLLMQQQIAILGALGLEASKKNMRKLTRSLHEESFRILVLGELKRGKSTLINALLGQDVLPSAAVPTTALLTEVKWGKSPVVLLHHRTSAGNLKAAPEKITLDDAKEYIAAFPKQHSSLEVTYEEIELRLPLDFCRDGLILIDSPGLNLMENQGEMVTNLLSSADAVIFVLAVDRPLSISERRAIDFIRTSGHEDIFFVVTRIDVIPPDEQNELQGYLIAKLRSFLGEEVRYIFFVSSQQALKGRLSDDTDLLDASGLLAVEKELKTFIATERGRKKLLVLATELRASVDEAQRTLLERAHVSGAGWKLTRESHRLIAYGLKDLEGERTSIVRFFGGFLSSLKDEIYEEADNFCKSVVSRINYWVDTYELETPMRLLETFSSSSRERVAEEVLRFITSKVKQELAEWQKSKLEPLLSKRLERLSRELDLRVQQFARIVGEIRLGIVVDAGAANAAKFLSQDALSTKERITLTSSQLFLENISETSKVSYLKGHTLSFSTIVKDNALPLLTISSAAAASPLISSFFPGPLTSALGTLIGSNMNRNMNKKIKNTVAQEYTKAFLAFSSELAYDITKNINTQLQSFQESLSDALNLEINNLRDKIKLLPEKQLDQVRINEELPDFTTLSDELDMIKTSVSKLIAQVSLLEVAS